MSQPIGKLNCVSLPVKNFEESILFYEQTLGLALTWMNEKRNWAEFDAGGIQLAIYPTHSDKEVRGGDTGFQVTDIESVYNSLNAAGISFKRGLEEYQMDGRHWKVADFCDPSGNRLMITQNF